MLDQASVLAMFESYSTSDSRLAELIAEVVGPKSVPEIVQVTVMPGESIHDIYFGRRITAGDAGIEVVGIDTFLETMVAHQEETVGLFTIRNTRRYLLCVMKQETRRLLACVGQFNDGRTRPPIAIPAPALRREYDPKP